VTRAAPHYLIADGAPLAVRRTRGGDAWQARAAGAAPAPATSVAADQPVLLGMPALGRPA
jgi:tRNA-2-methylthio-N6-dimethylallyladenosine synthase